MLTLARSDGGGSPRPSCRQEGGDHAGEGGDPDEQGQLVGGEHR